MHQGTKFVIKKFIDCYVKPDSMLLDLGGADVNGTIKDMVPDTVTYKVMDIENSPGVDYVLDLNNPYTFPIPDNYFDTIIASSVFEHVEFFWLTFLECHRVLKPGGALLLSAPANYGAWHRHPVDCWRFMPDSATSLEGWAAYNNKKFICLESFEFVPDLDIFRDLWIDHTSIFVKDLSEKVSADSLVCFNVYGELQRNTYVSQGYLKQ